MASQALDIIVAKHMPLIHGVLRGFAPVPSYIHDDMESAGVGALLRAATNYLNDGETRPFQPYAATAIQRAMLDVIRARSRYLNHIEAHYHNSQARFIVPNSSEWVDGRMDCETLRSHLDRAIVRLPEAQQEVVRLHYFDGLELKDLAHQTGRAEGTVKSLAYTARMNLANDPQLRTFYERNFPGNKRAA